MSLHKNLKDVVEDHLALASMHYLRSHFQEASEIYKQLLLEYREYAALQSHLALCHYKLDFYDIAQEVNSVYLSMYPTSTIGLNLKVRDVQDISRERRRRKAPNEERAEKSSERCKAMRGVNRRSSAEKHTR